ncbi:MAG: class I SAM-dependent methyltransferase [Bacillota bacterium]
MTNKILLNNNMLDITLLEKLSQKPEVFTPGEELFWNDEHISKKMLEAHLNPDWDATSFRHSKIDEIVKFLIKKLKIDSSSKLLDLGCGPGLYASRLYKLTKADITGIDFSTRSIEYAKSTAKEESMAIRYIFGDYLKLEYPDIYDHIFLIYYDLGVLNDASRDILLSKVNKALKHGGSFVLDITTPKQHEERKEESSWYAAQAGFWKPAPHLVLEQYFQYIDYQTALDQYIVIGEAGDIKTYRVYDHYYDVDSITVLLNSFGFTVEEIWEDLSGTPYSNESKTMGILAKKTKAIDW